MATTQTSTLPAMSDVAEPKAQQYEVRDTTLEAAPDTHPVTLVSPDGVTATFVPDAGMVGASATFEGEEFLGQRAGIAAYRESGKTFGIPLLAPWANRVVATEFDGVDLQLDGTPGVHPDANGLAIHGLLAGCPDWEVTRKEAVQFGEDEGAWLVATLKFDESRPEFPAFPFAHQLTISVRLKGRKLTVSTSLEAIGDRRVPVAFGFHPYFAPPGADRQDWTLERPLTHHLLLDDRSVPTGEVEWLPVGLDTLGDPANGGITYDDLYDEVAPGTKVWLEGGRMRITFDYVDGYDYAVLYAPADAPLVAIEPMTAPTDPLAGKFPIRVVEPGDKFTAIFAVSVERT